MNGIMPVDDEPSRFCRTSRSSCPRWLGDGAGRCGQCRLFPHDDTLSLIGSLRTSRPTSDHGTATVTAPLTINLTNRGRKWVLNNVVFNDGGTASGYFMYDPAHPGNTWPSISR